MNEVNLKYRVRAEILTPLSIGQGSEKDWVEGIDFIVKDKVLYHLDMSRMIAAGVDINRLSSCFVSGRPMDVVNLIGGKLEQVSDSQMKMPCASSNPVKTFLRNQLTNRPVLAGSSLKGAIRSILFTHLRETERRNEEVFGNMKEGNDFMRFIRVGDMEFDNTTLINTKIYNLHGNGSNWEGGWKHELRDRTNTSYNPVGFNTIYECLFPGKQAEGSLMLATTLFDRMRDMPHAVEKAALMKAEKPNEILCDIINDHTFAYLQKESEFFYEYQQGKYAGNIINSIDNLMDVIDACEPNQCVIKMSAGAGFHSITGDWQYDDYTDTGYYSDADRRNAGKKKYKSRKIATYGDHFDLMGFVKLTIE